MRIRDLYEIPVRSSWLSDLTYDDNSIILTISTGERYIINGVPETVYNDWVDAKSKGQFFHQKIKNAFTIKPL